MASYCSASANCLTCSRKSAVSCGVCGPIGCSTWSAASSPPEASASWDWSCSSSWCRSGAGWRARPIQVCPPSNLAPSSARSALSSPCRSRWTCSAAGPTSPPRPPCWPAERSRLPDSPSASLSASRLPASCWRPAASGPSSLPWPASIYYLGRWKPASACLPRGPMAGCGAGRRSRVATPWPSSAPTAANG